MDAASPPDLDALDRFALDLADRIAGRTDFANAGRLAVYLDPAEPTWPVAAAIARDCGALAFAESAPGPVREGVATHLGPEWDVTDWNVYSAEAASAVTHAAAIIEAIPLPTGWQTAALTQPDPVEIAEVIALNLRVGVSPVPPVAMRGGIGDALTVTLRDSAGTLAASAMVHMMFPAGSRLEGVAFLGLVCVSPEHRGRGLGKLANAHALLASHSAFGWPRATEFVADDNPVSAAMVRACGLTRLEGVAAMIAMPGGARFTR